MCWMNKKKTLQHGISLTIFNEYSCLCSALLIHIFVGASSICKTMFLSRQTMDKLKNCTHKHITLSYTIFTTAKPFYSSLSLKRQWAKLACKATFISFVDSAIQANICIQNIFVCICMRHTKPYIQSQNFIFCIKLVLYCAPFNSYWVERKEWRLLKEVDVSTLLFYTKFLFNQNHWEFFLFTAIKINSQISNIKNEIRKEQSENN